MREKTEGYVIWRSRVVSAMLLNSNSFILPLCTCMRGWQHNECPVCNNAGVAVSCVSKAIVGVLCFAEL